MYRGMNEHEIIYLIEQVEKKLHEGVDSFTEYIILCARRDTLHDQLIEVISSKNTMKKTVKPAKKATKKVAKKVVGKKKKVVAKKKK